MTEPKEDPTPLELTPEEGELLRVQMERLKKLPPKNGSFRVKIGPEHGLPST